MSIVNNRREALDCINQAIALINSNYKLGDDLLLDNLREVVTWLEEEIESLQEAEET